MARQACSQCRDILNLIFETRGRTQPRWCLSTACVSSEGERRTIQWHFASVLIPARYLLQHKAGLLILSLSHFLLSFSLTIFSIFSFFSFTRCLILSPSLFLNILPLFLTLSSLSHSLLFFFTLFFTSLFSFLWFHSIIISISPSCPLYPSISVSTVNSHHILYSTYTPHAVIGMSR